MLILLRRIACFLIWSDPTIAVDWGNNTDFILSDKDISLPLLGDIPEAELL